MFFKLNVYASNKIKYVLFAKRFDYYLQYIYATSSEDGPLHLKN